MLLLEQTSIIASAYLTTSAYLTNWYQSHMKQMSSGMYMFQVPELKKKKEKKRQLL